MKQVSILNITLKLLCFITYTKNQVCLNVPPRRHNKIYKYTADHINRETSCTYLSRVLNMHVIYNTHLPLRTSDILGYLTFFFFLIE